MKERIKFAIIVFLLGSTIYLCFRNYSLKTELNKFHNKEFYGKTDTVRIKQDFNFTQSYRDLLSPRRILFYDPPKLWQFPDTSSYKLGPGNKPYSSAGFSEKDSLTQILLDKEQLNLSFLSKSGVNSSRLYDLNLDEFKYNWYNGKLTYQKTKTRIKLTPYIYGKYRYFNNMFDFGGGISFKTKGFIYKLGINTFYYPQIQSSVGTDIEVSIEYTF